MEVLLFVFLFAVIFGAKAKERLDKKWEDSFKPRIVENDTWLVDTFCDREYERELMEKYPPDGEVTQERLALVSGVARDILLGGPSRFTERDLDEQTRVLAQKYVVDILMVQKGLIPYFWTRLVDRLDYCERLVFLWGFQQLRLHCEDLRVIEYRDKAFWSMPADMKPTPDTYYECPREAYLARTVNTTW